MLSFCSLQSSKIRLPPYSDPCSISHSLHRSSILSCDHQKQTSKYRSLCFGALDAAQPYDFETVNDHRFEKSKKLKIAIVGFGNFGQFLEKTLVRQGHNVLAHSGSDYSDIAKKLGVVVSTESVLRSLPLQRLKRSSLFFDVLSVQEFLRKVFLQILPPEFDVLCTHPVFAPESGKHNWKGLPFVYDKVRIGDEESRISCCENFLNIFAQEGCRMVEMSCAEHDRDETLLNLVENTSGDYFELYYSLFIYMAFESLKRKSYRHLHEILGKQLFKNAEGLEESDKLKPPSENMG
ncbi:hypothetical protein MKW92_037945 [Papaver armeniacum]|nr:hypothetical protein MKW92_037945 [Papaver armeniacum]